MSELSIAICLSVVSVCESVAPFLSADDVLLGCARDVRPRGSFSSIKHRESGDLVDLKLSSDGHRPFIYRLLEI